MGFQPYFAELYPFSSAREGVAYTYASNPGQIGQVFNGNILSNSELVTFLPFTENDDAYELYLDLAQRTGWDTAAIETLYFSFKFHVPPLDITPILEIFESFLNV